MNKIIPVSEPTMKTRLILKKIRGLSAERYSSLGGLNPIFLGESVRVLEEGERVDEHHVLEVEPKKYSYDEVLECMRQACTLSLMSNKFPKDSELEQLIPRPHD